MEDIFDNFGSFIYIIITIAAFAISALGKKKKKKRGNTLPLNNENPSVPKKKPFLSNLEQLIKEEMGITNNANQNEYITEPIIDRHEEEVLDSVSKKLLDNKESKSLNKEYEDTGEVLSNSIEDHDLTKVGDKFVIEDFNLRDAVIYSEIINRKEY